jgi:putative oxidoreductase
MVARYSDHVLMLTRIIFAFLYFCHGSQKLFGWFGGHPVHGQPLFLAGGIIEVVGGVLIAFGLGARIAAFVCSGEMAVAYFLFHASRSFWPILNHGEIVVAFCFFFLYIAAHGAGRFSIDTLLHRHRPSPNA